jgi:hypothetical protein
MGSTISIFSFASLLVFAVAACGGATTNIEDGGNDGGALGDGGSLNDGDSLSDEGALGASCPATAPTNGTGCPTDKLTCEYGGKGPQIRCSTVFTCQHAGTGAGMWTSDPPSPDCVGTQGDNAPSCPASFAALASGAACPQSSGDCVYAEGLCACEPCRSPDAGGSTNLWTCRTWPEPPPPCPSPRARAGSACSVEGQDCSYAAPCSPVNIDQPDLKCVNGLWEDQPIAQPPCAFATCGQ